MAVFQIWKDSNGTTVAEFHDILWYFAKGLLPMNSELLHTFEANTPLEVFEYKARYLYDEEYHPMLDENGKIEAFYYEKYPY